VHAPDQAEADLAAALYVELCTFMRAEATRLNKTLPAPSVGVVTPYRQQKAALKDAFQRAAGPEALMRVRLLFTTQAKLHFRPKQVAPAWT
jgi:hypothetical protein